MNEERYVISTKVVKNNEMDLLPNEQYWAFAGEDPFGCIDFKECVGRTFISVDEAEAWWEEFGRTISKRLLNKFDLDTLAIRKIEYAQVKSLEVIKRED